MKWIAFLMLLLLAFAAALAAPEGATLVSNTTETVAPASAGSSTTAGGSFTTLVLNATTQTPRWKAYVGNASGSVTLRDGGNNSIYDWGSASSGGEVYSSRNASPDWSTIACANATTITNEESFLNHSVTAVDSINNTFNQSVHAEFYTGSVQLPASNCPAIALNVNNTGQTAAENATFQEILLQDNNGAVVYASLINFGQFGYDGTSYDFQMIVPEDEYSSPSTYYFWLELS